MSFRTSCHAHSPCVQALSLSSGAAVGASGVGTKLEPQADMSSNALLLCNYVSQSPTVRMLGHGPDYAINEEAEIFANCWPEAPEFLLSPSASLSPDHRSQKRPRPNQQPHWPGRHPSTYHGPRGHPFGSSSYGPPRPPPQHDPLRLLTRVVLQQEQTISRLRHDKAFVLFMKQGEDGTLGALMRVAKEWNNKKSQENSTVRSPLRTVLLSRMIGALLKLAQQAVATEDNKQKMVTAEWLTANSEWTYRVWNHAERRLVVDTNKTPLQHAQATRILTFLLEHLTGKRSRDSTPP